jgi:hypothetical protein
MITTMPFSLDDATALLARTPTVIDAWLRHLPAAWVDRREGDGTWTAHEIVGHLIHGERFDWMPRTRTILEHGENKTFEPFDRAGNVRESQDESLGALLDEFARLRSVNLRDLKALGLGPADFERRGRHPVFGLVTLGQLLSTWTVHDLTHLHQLSRVMADQYRAAVGPWEQYLGVLHCDGHG